MKKLFLILAIFGATVANGQYYAQVDEDVVNDIKPAKKSRIINQLPEELAHKIQVTRKENKLRFETKYELSEREIELIKLYVKDYYYKVFGYYWSAPDIVKNRRGGCYLIFYND